MTEVTELTAPVRPTADEGQARADLDEHGYVEKWGEPLRHLLGYDNYVSLGMIDGMPRTGPRY